MKPSVGATNVMRGSVPSDLVHPTIPNRASAATTGGADQARYGLWSNILVAILLLVVAAACNPTTAATRADLELYLKRANDWAPVEAETARTVARILATQFVDEAEVRRQIIADQPRVAEHLARIEAVQPTSEEVREIHRGYVDTWQRLARGYEAVLRGLDKGQVPDLAAGRASLEAWREGIVATARQLRRLQSELPSS